MGRVCLQCGDKGFSNAFIYCVKCLNGVVHRYCLDKLPETFDEFVYWVCDDCEVQLQNEFTSLKADNIQFEGSGHISSKDVDGQLTVVKRKKPRPRKQDWKRIMKPSLLEAKQRRESSPNKQPRDATAKSDPIFDGGDHTSSKDVDGQVTVIKRKRKKQRPRLQGRKRNSASFSGLEGKERLESRPSKQLQGADLTNSTPLSTKFKKKEGSCLESKVEDRGLRPVEESTELELAKEAKRRLESRPSEQPQDAELASNSQLSTDFKIKEASFTASKVEDHSPRSGKANTKLELTVANTKLELTEKRNKAHELSSLEKCIKKRMDVKFSSADLADQGAKECLETSQSALGCLEKNSTLESHENAQPLIEPIWRGGFIILNKDYDAFDGLVAHLSSKACQKVYEEASMFPSLLDLDMLPKSDVWPKSFQRSEPSDDNIALYFFPSDKRYERLFDYLVEEMMHQGNALRAIVKNAELLVFPSTELPLSCWRFQGKYYLWGVFRGKQGSSSHAVRQFDGIAQGTKLLTAKHLDVGSPLSPLCNNGSFGSGNL